MSSSSRSETGLSTRNHILSSLPADDLARLMPSLESVKLESGKMLIESQVPFNYVYFPNYAMVSIVATTPAGQSAEVGVVGWEGVVGVDAFLGINNTLNVNMVQIPNGGHRMTVDAARDEFQRGGAFHELSLSFIRVMMLQISQTALCNRLHTVENRLARWLLSCHDRTDGDVLALTQEFLGLMLGTSRVTVTQTAGELQAKGHIDYVRGKITVRDRAGLEAETCDCYHTIKDEYDRYIASTATRPQNAGETG